MTFTNGGQSKLLQWEITLKKKIIALASIATLSAITAHAQSSVTAYGLIDASLQNISNVGSASAHASVTRMSASAIYSSVWGLKGSEDLGNGMRGVFRMEGDVNPTNGTNNPTGIFRRAANAGLSGSFGSVTAGVELSPFILASIISAPGWSNSDLVNASISGGYAHFFTANAITYTLPTIGMVSGQIQYALGGQAGSSRGNYTNGYVAVAPIEGLNLIAAFEQLNPGGQFNTQALATGNNSLFGATYAFGPLAVGVQAVKAMTGSNGSTGIYTKTDQVSAKYQINGPLSIRVNYVTNDGQGASKKNTMTNEIAMYDFSKTTAVYGIASQVNNGTARTFEPIFQGDGVGPGYPYGVASATANSFGVGIIKRF